MNNANIVIIGAGPSGIAAATKLLELGFQKVTIVEAENRIGGRIHTIPFADNVVDMGAQWCHGEKDNVVYELASKHNLLEHSNDTRGKYECIRSNQEVIPLQLDQRFKAITEEIMEKRNIDLVNYDGSLGSYVSGKFFEALQRPENADIDRTIAKEFFQAYLKIENSAEGCDDLKDVAGRTSLEYWDSDGDQMLHWKGKGYLEFLRLLLKSKEIGTELGVLNDRVRLSKPVKQITWNGSNVQVHCKDDEVIEADHVIVTVSLGVLKDKHLSLFDPQLPEEKVRAIKGIAFGTVNKIYIEFPSPFWSNDWLGFLMLWREEDLKDIRGTNRAWLEDIFGFFPVSDQPRILCGWMVSANARHMETLPKEEIINGCMYLLRRFLKWNVLEPLTFKNTSWFKNENFKGSYSYRSVLTEEMNTNAADLGSPLKNSDQKPVVLFAGEATSDHHFSTVHGAVESGWREAERLSKFYEEKAN